MHHSSILRVGEDTSQHLERGRDTLQYPCLGLGWVEAFAKFHVLCSSSQLPEGGGELVAV